MSNTPFIVDVTEANFNELVIENSYKQPVFVDFWASWCGPCKSLMPVLEKLANDYQGQIILAKVNSDEEQTLTGTFAVRSLPTVKVFKKGREVDSFTGAQPEPVIRTIIETHIDRESDKIRDKGLEAIRAGDIDTGLEQLKQAIEMEPSRDELKLDLAKGYVAAHDAEKAEQTIASLPFNLRNSEQAEKTLGMIKFIKATENAPDHDTLEKFLHNNPDDLDTRFQLGALKILNDENEAGLKQFLEIMQRDRKYDDDAGYKAILAVFRLLGDEHDLVKQYRRKMAMLLH